MDLALNNHPSKRTTMGDKGGVILYLRQKMNLKAPLKFELSYLVAAVQQVKSLRHGMVLPTKPQ